MNRKKMGRPPIDNEGSRDVSIGIRIRKEQHAIICQAAEKLGLSMSTYCRMAALEKAAQILKE